MKGVLIMRTTTIEQLETRQLLSAATLLKTIDPAYGYGIQCGDYAFFVANTADPTAVALWRTDGTGAGTIMLREFRAAPQFCPTMIPVGGELFFVASDALHPQGLWKSDGTVAGTQYVKGVEMGHDSTSWPDLYGAAVGNKLFFSAENPWAQNYNEELWVSDGTETGTYQVKEINHTPTWEAPSTPRQFTAVGDVAFFTANDGTHGRELWRSDGTEAGTYLVKDLNPGPSDLWGVYSIQAIGSKAYFSGQNSAGSFLWSTNGTEADTFPLTQVTGWRNSLMGVVGNQLLFQPDISTGDLWISDGSPSGTHMLKQLGPASGANTYGIREFATIGDKAYFAARGEIWVTDGTEIGTVMLKDFTRGTNPNGINWITNYHGSAMFAGTDDFHGTELWASNGTPESTAMVRDVLPGLGSSRPMPVMQAKYGDVFMGAQGDYIWNSLWRLPTYNFPYNFRIDARSPHTLAMTFFADVSASLDPTDLYFVNVDTGEAIDPSAMAVTFDAQTRTARFTFPGIPNGRLAEGQYRGTILAGAVSDAGGVPLGQDEIFDVHLLLGDANQDGRVNVFDFTVLAANFNQTGRDYTQGDFNYDGLVNVSDFQILATRFNRVVPQVQGATFASGRVIDSIESLK
jgi:ELWxxDGT repeat protein